MQITQEQADFNRSMSRVHECVKWEFKKVISNFAFVDFKKGLSIYLQPVGKMYFVAVLLTNCHTCFYGSQTSIYFDLAPPNLHVYLHF
jgi:hypothetical protein